MRTPDKRVVVSSTLTRPTISLLIGALAQLGEHLLCKQGVIGSIPIGSTISYRSRWEVANSVIPEMKTTVPAFERVFNGASASFIGTLTL